MKRYIGIGFSMCIIIVLIFVFKNTYSEYSIGLKDDALSYEVKFKGVKASIDFAVDESNNYYIAYKDRIQIISSKGSSYDLFRDKSLNINSLEYKDNKLYFSSEDKIYCYDISKDEKIVLIDNLPNYGDYKESKIKFNKDYLYISVGAATNSGIVGSDNTWVNTNPFYHDISPKDITLKGINFGSEKTGAFVPYKTKNTFGQIVPAHMPGNASIVRYNVQNKSLDTFAWGIRNVNDMCFANDGRLITSVGGMEDRGLRPVRGDVDYIYEIKAGLWYGWPDYSGGDPVSSPRFKGENNKKQSFILENHPTTNPAAPIYQHKHLDSLRSLEFDSKAVLGEKDCIYFYDNRDNILYALKKSGAVKEAILFKKEMNVQSLKILDNSLIILDSKSGVISNVYKQGTNSTRIMDKGILYYLILLTIAIISILIWKFNNISKRE